MPAKRDKAGRFVKRAKVGVRKAVRKAKAKRAGNKAAARRSASRPNLAGRVNVDQLGTIRSITFERVGSDTLKIHEFRKGTRIFVSDDRRSLIIHPVRVTRGIIAD